MFTQIDHGCQPTDFPPSTTTVKIPAALQLKYWEVQTPEIHFTKDQLESVLTRRKEREQARKNIESQLAGLDDLEKWDLIKGDKAEKGEKVKKDAGAAKKETSAVKVESAEKTNTVLEQQEVSSHGLTTELTTRNPPEHGESQEKAPPVQSIHHGGAHRQSRSRRCPQKR